VFISYSRVDRDWVERIRKVMAPLLRQEGNSVQLWDDSQIQPGDSWLSEIETALAGAQVALLLVSAEFLASEFVMGKEVPELLRAAVAEGVTILWVPLSACLVRHTPIHAYQAVLPPEQTLDAMGPPQQSLALVRVAEAVHEALRQAEERTRQRQEQARLEQERLEREAAAAKRQRAEEQSRQRQLEQSRQLQEEERAAQEAERQRQQQERQVRQERQEAAAAERQRAREQAMQRQQEEKARRERERQDRAAAAAAEQQRAEHEARQRQQEAAAERQRAWQGLIAWAARGARLAGQANWRSLLSGPALPQIPLSRRQLLLTAGGLPLAWIGLGTIAQRFWRPGTSTPAISSPPGPLTPAYLNISHGQLERQQGGGWLVRRTPIMVPAVSETLGQGVALRLIGIRAGGFLMGSPPGEAGRSIFFGPQAEGPQHRVMLAGFWLGQTPITQAQWQVVARWPLVRLELNPDPSYFKGSNRPVEQVNWEEAIEFCARLSKGTGRTYSLPSEAQWEYACRAGTTTPFHFGETISPELANYNVSGGYLNDPEGLHRGETTNVGMFPANAWGLQDMHGNVWEWCLDHFHDSYQGAPADGSAWLKGGDESTGLQRGRLLRGGSWLNGPESCRSATRVVLYPGNQESYVGFRVCCLPQG
jgi:formylglycine-generating enzyme required for sulfatase activity